MAGNARIVSEDVMQFTIPGRPLGSGRGLGYEGNGSYLKNRKAYMNIVKLAAKTAVSAYRWECLDAPVYVTLAIYLGPGHELKPNVIKEMYKNKNILVNRRPNMQALAEAVLTAFKGILFAKDGNVVGLLMVKKHAQEQRIEVQIGRPKNYGELSYDLRNA